MPKDTKRSAKSASAKTYFFDNQQVTISDNQAYYKPGTELPAALVPGPSADAPCPVWLRTRVELKQLDREAKRLANLTAQRSRRKAAKELAAVEYFPANAVLVVTPQGLQLDQVPVAEVAPVPVPAPAPAPRVRFPMAELAEATAPLEEKWKRSKRAKARKSASEPKLDTIDVTPPHLKGWENLKKLRSQCRQTGKMLLQRGKIAKPLSKAGAKIMNCSLWGLFQSVSTDVNYKVGTALCKNRLCPNCQRVLSAKRRNNFLEWWAANRAALRPYFFYHLVLTVRHSTAEGLRTDLYTSELLGYFAKLRGTHTSLPGAERRWRSKVWKNYVAGGTYSVEVKAGRDQSPHIHIHCLLVAKRQLTNRAQQSKFLEHVEALWREITGNVGPDRKEYAGVFLDKTYFKDAEGNRVDAFKGSDVQVEFAVAETEKYTLKADAESLMEFDDQFLCDLLTMRNRYYSRFGCFSANDKSSAQFTQLDKLCTDYQDLEQVTRSELARLFNPETGEVIEPEQTEFVATPLRNMRPQPAHEVREAAEVEVKMLPTGKIYPLDGGPLAGRPVLAPVVVSRSEAAAPEFQAPEIYYSAVVLPAYLARAQYRFFPYEEKQRAAIWLSRGIAGDYDPKLELEYEPKKAHN